MSGCSVAPMWSGVRFVKTPSVYSQHPTRSSLSPCDETSITHFSQPSRTMRLRSGWRTFDSGVVLSVGTISAPTMLYIVPTRPDLWPACSRMFLIISDVVVLPLVPVTPIRPSSPEGWPQNASDKTAAAVRVECVRTSVRFPLAIFRLCAFSSASKNVPSCITTQTAPFDTASSAKM